MSGGPGLILAEWSETHSAWCSLVVSPKARRADLLHLAGRLSLSNHRVLRLVPVVEVDDEDEEEAALSKERPPRGVWIVHPEGDPNS